MANKEIIFSIQIEGNEQLLKNLNQAKDAVSDINKRLKTTKDEKAYKLLEEQLIKAKSALNDFNKQQVEAVKYFESAKFASGSFEQLSFNIKQTTIAYKKLSKEERESEAGKRLLESIKANKEELKNLNKELSINNKEVKENENEIKAAKGSYTALNDEIKNLTNEYKNLSKEQRDGVEGQALKKSIVENKKELSLLNKELKVTKEEVKAADGSYDDLNKQLVVARRRFKELSQEEREGSIGKELLANIQGLDKELKDLDKSIGQNQRNVGNYEQAISNALGGFGDQIVGTIDGFKSIGEAAKNAGTLISKAFVALQAVQVIVEIVGAIDEFVGETREAQRQIEATFGTLGEETDRATAQIKALSDTFNIEFDDSLKATNALVQQFGVDIDEATTLLSDGLASAGNQTAVLGIVTDELGKLSSAGIDASEAVGLITEATNKGINIDVISEGIISLRENTDATAEAIKNAFGAEKAKQIADAFKKEPIEAIKLVSSLQKQLDQNSQESAELIANVFKGVGEENIKSVQAIADLNGSLDDLKKNAGENAQRLDELGQANLRLNEAQVEVSNSLKGVIGNSDAFTANVKTGLLLVLSEILKAVQPLIDSVKNLFNEFKTGGDSVGFLAKVTKVLSLNLKIVSGVLAAIGNLLTLLVKTIKSTIAESEVLTKAFDFVSSAFNKTIAIVSDLQSAFSGVQVAAKQLAKNIKNSFKGILIDFEIFGKKAKQLVKFGEADREIQRQINNLRKERKKLNEENLSVLEAFNKGFEDAQKARLKKQAELEAAERAQAVKAEQQQQNKILQEKQKGDAKLRKQQEDAAKKRLEALKKEQEKFLQEQQKIALTRAALINELSKKIRDQEVKNLGNTLDARLQARENKFKDEIAAIEQNLLSIEQLQNDAEQEAIRLFGENSLQVIELRQRQAKELERIQFESEALQLAKQQEFETDKLKIIEDNEKKQQQLRQANLNNTIADINFNTQVELTALKNKFAQGLIDQQDYNKQVKQLQLANVQSQIDANNQELQALQQLRASGTAINEQYFKELELKTQQLQVQQIELTNSIEQNNFIISESIANVINLALENTQKGLDFIDQIYASAAEKEQQRVDQQIQSNEQQVSELESRLQQSAGLERQFLQQQIDNEIKEGQRLEKEKAKLEKEEAKRQKRFAIGQAIINGALAVTKILATTPFPLSLIESVRVAATTAAEVAVISAQQFAQGGKVGAANIKQLSNGDNVLATVKTGEVVLNKRQQKALGGDRAFASIGVPGFASGGLVGSVLSPALAAPTSALDEQIQFLSTLQSNIEAVNNRIDNIQVSLNTDEEQREQEDRQENILFATLTTDENV